MPGEALRDALGAAGGTLAVLTAHPPGVMPCLGGGEELGGECLPLLPACRSRALGMQRWAGGHACLDGRQPQPAAQRLRSDGGACNPEGLADTGGKERLIQQRKVPDNKLPAGLEWCTHFTG